MEDERYASMDMYVEMYYGTRRRAPMEQDGWEDCDKPFNVDGKTILVAAAKQGIDEQLEANRSVWSDKVPTTPGHYWIRRHNVLTELDVIEVTGPYHGAGAGVWLGDDSCSSYQIEKEGWKFGPRLTPPPGPK